MIDMNMDTTFTDSKELGYNTVSLKAETDQDKMLLGQIVELVLRQTFGDLPEYVPE